MLSTRTRQRLPAARHERGDIAARHGRGSALERFVTPAADSPATDPPTTGSPAAASAGAPAPLLAPGAPARRDRVGHRRPPPRSPGRWALLAGVATAPACGVLLISQSYRDSLAGAGDGFFLVFWAGMALGYAPLCTVMTLPRVPRGQRQLAVAALGMFSFAPKYLRNADGPLYFDEWAHWTQINDVSRLHHLYVPNDQVPIVQQYPGLHALGSALQQVTGLPAWDVGLLVILLAHVLAGVAVFLIAETMLTGRAAGVAAAVYMSNAAWVYFDTQVAYESLGVALVMWTLYFAARLYQARVLADRFRWSGLLVLSGLTCVVTHHLSTYLLSGILYLCLLSLSAASVVGMLRRRSWGGLHVFWLAVPSFVVSGGLALYVRFVAPATAAYLGTSGLAGIGQLLRLFDAGPGAGPRTPFGGSAAPGYERIAAYLAPLLVAAALALHAVASRGFSRDYRRGLALPMSWMALGYVLSLPLVLTLSGAESSRRSWAFTYLGVALVLGSVVTRVDGRSRRLGSALVAVCLPILVVGNLAAGQNVAYRFPGPYLYGSDTRSLTENMRAAMERWAAIRPAGSGVVADRFDGVLYQSQPDAALASPTQGPIRSFYLDDAPIGADYAQSLARNGFLYLVVDKRITSALPLIGGYFSDDTPNAPKTPPDDALLRRWTVSPYTTLVYDSDQVSVYRLDARYVALQPRTATPVLAPPPAPGDGR